MAQNSPDFDDWIARARAVTVQSELTRRGLWSRRMAGDNGVPCPGCGGTDRFSVNTKKNVWQCRRSGLGGDALALCAHIDGTEFLASCETLTGAPMPGRGVAETEEEKRARLMQQAQRAEEERQRLAQVERENEDYRVIERRRCWTIWSRALPAAGTPVEDYLALRKLALPADAHLRFAGEHEYWDRPGGRIIHRGQAMLAKITGPDGQFAGVHATWLDLTEAKGKAIIIDGDGVVMKSKKSRGSIKGGMIFLSARSQLEPLIRLYVGEGIETVLAVWCEFAEKRPDLLEGAVFASSISLGNLARTAENRVVHPTRRVALKNGGTRAAKVPGNIPKAGDPWPLMRLPATLQEMILLRDGDSDPFDTRMALERAAAGYAQAFPHLTIRLADAGDGFDFNDLRGRT